MLQRWKIVIEYDGSNYHGWQLQDDIPTIQGAMEDAIYGFCQQRIRLHVTGRTDAGVHAFGQVAHFDLDYPREISGFDILKAINAHLRPQPIAVISAAPVSSDFHARYSARKKLYRYKISNRPAFLALEQSRAWHIKIPLNAEKMHEAAQVLLGEHDFSSFRAAACQAKSPIRSIESITVSSQKYESGAGQDIIIDVTGQSFLHHMVRNIVGSLVLVGHEKWTKNDLRNALLAKDRKAGGPTAPPEGLYLVHIEF